MPDLGKYADTVLSAYGVSVAVLLVLVGVSIWRGRRVRARLATIERRMRRDA